MSGVTVAPAFRQGWNRFWFAPVSTAPVELFRIAFGLLALVWMLSLAPVLEAFYGDGRAVPPVPPLSPGAWTIFSLASGSGTAWCVWAIGLAAAVALVIGCGTRLAAVVLFVVIVSLIRQSPWVYNAGDSLIRVLAFYMMFMPAGSALSVDRWRTDRARFWTFPRRAPWALRLAQIQLSVIYLSTVWEKSGGVLWRDGSAVSIALRVLNVNRVPTPAAVTDSVGLVQLMTFGTLAAEAAIGILVWNHVARPWVLAIGVILHLSIDISLTIGFFSFAMFTLYLSFLSPRAAERATGAARSIIERRREDPPDAGPGDDGPTPAVPEQIPRTSSPIPEHPPRPVGKAARAAPDRGPVEVPGARESAAPTT